MLGILLPVGPLQRDGLDFVRSLMKWLGRRLRNGHVRRSRHRMNSLASEPNDKAPNAEAHVTPRLSGNLVCREISRVPHGHIND